MRNQTISHRQLAWLIAAGFMTSTTILLPQQLALYSGNDAWFAPIFCAIYALLACYVFYRLAKRYPGQTIFQITKLLAGKWIGSLLNIIILFNIWLVFVRNARLFINFVKLNLLPSTPEEILLLLLVVVLIYYGSTSIEVTARVNELFFPFLFLITLLLPLLLSNELSIYQLEPVLVKPAADLTLSGLIASSWYGDVIVVGAFLHTIYNSKQLYSAMRHGILLSVFGLTILCIVGIAVLGANTLGKENYPSYVLAEQIHISDFLDRVELILFSIYFPTFLVSIMTAFLALLIGVASFTKTRDYTFYSRSMGWLMLLAVYLAFPGARDPYLCHLQLPSLRPDRSARAVSCPADAGPLEKDNPIRAREGSAGGRRGSKRQGRRTGRFPGRKGSPEDAEGRAGGAGPRGRNPGSLIMPTEEGNPNPSAS
ncbi:endospore germination permease [Paenibacillus sp. CC-CFT747]|nr:endospore germination permease [Paenibacillus sp. CC-CFT747]